jgi:hypothetical protein
MPLNDAEREFLDAYVYEATHEPFGGPATTALREKGIAYSDLLWLLTAYDRELCADRILPFGRKNKSPPPSPWTDSEHAGARNQAMRAEYEQRQALPGNEFEKSESKVAEKSEDRLFAK